jgi:TonB family protein
VATQPQDLPDPTPDFQEPDPKPPGNPDKIAKAPDPIPNNANQTNLGSGTKTRQNWANDPNPPANDAPANNDDFGSGTPGNNQKIASSPNIAPANSSNQTGLAGGTSKNNRIGANFDGIGGEMNSSNDESIVGTPGNSSRIARSQSGGNGVGQNQASLSGGGGKKRTTSLGGDSNGSGAGIGNNDEFSGGAPGNIAAAGKPQAASIQCLRNCEIKYPDTLADADMGKDKILVKVTIDPGGSVTAAQIARSSGNSQLDRVTLDGIKQMQLTAMGKAMTFKVKVSTLTN